MKSRASSIFDGISRVLEGEQARVLRTAYSDNRDLLAIEEERERFLS